MRHDSSVLGQINLWLISQRALSHTHYVYRLVFITGTFLRSFFQAFTNVAEGIVVQMVTDILIAAVMMIFLLRSFTGFSRSVKIGALISRPEAKRNDQDGQGCVPATNIRHQYWLGHKVYTYFFLWANSLIPSKPVDSDTDGVGEHYHSRAIPHRSSFPSTVPCHW